MNHVLFCPHCDGVLVKSTQNEVKIRAKVVLLKSDAAFAVCRDCNAEVPVPLRLDSDMLKSLVQSSKKLYVTNK